MFKNEGVKEFCCYNILEEKMQCFAWEGLQIHLSMVRFM